MSILRSMRRPRPATWVPAALGAAVGIGLLLASAFVESHIPTLPPDIDGVDILFSPHAWGALLIGGAALALRAAAFGWSTGVVVGVGVASLGSVPTLPRRLLALAAPPAGAFCAVALLSAIG